VKHAIAIANLQLLAASAGTPYAASFL